MNGRIRIRGKRVVGGVASGQALVSLQPISFYGGIDPNSGVIVEKGHPLEGKCVAGKVLVFPQGKGSTVGSYIIYSLAKNGVAPAAILNEKTETIIAAGCAIANIPLMHRFEVSVVKAISTGDFVYVFADDEYVEVEKKSL